MLEDNENDDEQKEEGLRERVKIMKKIRKGYNRSSFILITKLSGTSRAQSVLDMEEL